MLGGSNFQIPAIRYARSAGHYVITADYLPDNPGHKYSHEYHNVSIVDAEKILRLAEKLRIDGIISYASDPGAPVAAYVSEKLGLPGNPTESVKILQRKDLFRNFLRQHGYNVPESGAFQQLEAAREYAEALLKKYPVIIKPADSSGSKGVAKLTGINDFNNYYANAMRYSLSRTVVVEQFIERDVYEMDGDGFVWKGNLVFRCFGNQHNDFACNAYVPAGISFPYIQSEAMQKKAHEIVTGILNKLNMRVGGLNIEYLTDKNGRIYILEIGPRNGGNMIPDVTKHSTGVDMIAYSIEGALGRDCSDIKCVPATGYFATYIIHSRKDGILRGVTISPELNGNIISKNIWYAAGHKAIKFNGSNGTIGTMILKFGSQDEMLFKMDNMDRFITVDVD